MMLGHLSACMVVFSVYIPSVTSKNTKGMMNCYDWVDIQGSAADAEDILAEFYSGDDNRVPPIRKQFTKIRNCTHCTIWDMMRPNSNDLVVVTMYACYDSKTTGVPVCGEDPPKRWKYSADIVVKYCSCATPLCNKWTRGEAKVETRSTSSSTRKTVAFTTQRLITQSSSITNNSSNSSTTPLPCVCPDGKGSDASFVLTMSTRFLFASLFIISYHGL